MISTTDQRRRVKSNAAQKKTTVTADPVFQAIGTVTAVDKTGYTVMTDRMHLNVQRAVTCLIEAQPMDKVLIAGTTTDKAYILAILERTDGSTLNLSTRGDLAIRTRNGNFSVVADKAIDLTGGELLKVSSKRVQAYTGQCTLFSNSIKVVGNTLHAGIERITQIAKTVFRQTSELESVRSEHIDLRAAKTLRLHSENTISTASELMKSDAKQIHVG